jgi:hypothetical protein
MHHAPVMDESAFVDLGRGRDVTSLKPRAHVAGFRSLPDDVAERPGGPPGP